MDGWMAATPGVPEDYGSVELSSSITSSSVVPEPRLLLLIHLRNKIHYTTPPPTTATYSLSHTHAHTPPIAPLSHQIGGGGQAGCETSWSSAQTKKPAECALASKRISDLSHCCFFTASTVLFHFSGCDAARSCMGDKPLILFFLMNLVLYNQGGGRVKTATNWGNHIVWLEPWKQNNHMTNHC